MQKLHVRQHKYFYKESINCMNILSWTDCIDVCSKVFRHNHIYAFYDNMLLPFYMFKYIIADIEDRQHMIIYNRFLNCCILTELKHINSKPKSTQRSIIVESQENVEVICFSLISVKGINLILLT